MTHYRNQLTDDDPDYNDGIYPDEKSEEIDDELDDAGMSIVDENQPEADAYESEEGDISDTPHKKHKTPKPDKHERFNDDYNDDI